MALETHDHLKTRQLSYRKDDRVMRPIYGCCEKFRVLTSKWLFFPKLVMGFWKFVALPVPDIIGVLEKIRQSLDTPTLPYLRNF